MPLKQIPVSDRFWPKVRKDPDSCWRWTGAKRGGGYGALWVGGCQGNHVPAHRVSYELAFGPVPEGLWVLHKCNNKDCVNPSHLYAGTVLENVRDAIRAGAWVDHRGRKAPWSTGTKNCNAVLNPDLVREIRKRHQLGESMRSLARAFKVDRVTIRNVLNGKVWSHVA